MVTAGNLCTFLAFVSLLLIGFWKETISGDEVGLVFLIIFLLIGIFWVSYAFTETITLSNYEIEHKTLFRNKRILFIGIRGRRVFLFRPRYRRSFRYLIVESKDERVQILIMERHFKFDDGFYRWFYQLPDLEETDKMADKNKLGDG